MGCQLRVEGWGCLGQVSVLAMVYLRAPRFGGQPSRGLPSEARRVFESEGWRAVWDSFAAGFARGNRERASARQARGDNLTRIRVI